jgi:hypothetical protein
MSQTTLFKAPAQLPEPNRQIIVVFVDRTMISPVEYCLKCEAWHSREGNLKPNRIYQWAYADEFYDSIDAPKPEKVEENSEDKEKVDAMVKALLLAALVSGTKSHGFRFH